MNTIPRRPVGTTSCTVPELGFGASAIGNLYVPMSDAYARTTLDTALDAGLRFIDTAPHYGRGLSERRVGDALRLQPDIVVSTKVGRLMEPDPSIRDDSARDDFRSPMPFRPRYDYSHDGILRSHEHSLHRLGLARLDILFVHDIGTRTHGEANAGYWDQLTRGGGLKALQRLRDEDAITAVGIGVNEVPVCLDIMAEMQLDAILLAGRYTLLEQDALDVLLPACTAARTSIIVGGPYNSGILATGTKGRVTAHYDYFPAPAAIMARVGRIEAIADRHGVSLPAAALQFVLAHPQIASVIPGLGSPDQVAHTVALYREAIPDDFWADLRADGMVRPDAPLPGTGS